MRCPSFSATQWTLRESRTAALSWVRPALAGAWLCLLLLGITASAIADDVAADGAEQRPEAAANVQPVAAPGLNGVPAARGVQPEAANQAGAAEHSVEAPAVDRGESAQPTATSKPAAPPAELATWIAQLGDQEFGVREDATRKIREVGLPAKPALVAALRHSDPEVRLRARRCLTEILDADFQTRLRAFENGQLADDQALPGWERFKVQIGDDAPARDLFVQMQKAEAGLMESVAAGGSVAAEAVALRCQQALQVSRIPDASMRQQPSLGMVSALLFVASDPSLKLPEQTQMLVFNFVNQQSFQTAIRSGTHQSHARKLLGNWIAETPSNNLAYQTLRLAMQHDIQEGLKPALRIALQKNLSSYMRMQGVLAVGKLGKPHHAADLVPLLDDATVCTSRTTVVNGKRTTYRIEMRDVTVAVLAHLTNQPLKDYGLQAVRTDPNMLFNTGTLGFSENEQRDAAIKKMKAWLDENSEKIAVPEATDKNAAKQGAPASADRAAGKENADRPPQGGQPANAQPVAPPANANRANANRANANPANVQPAAQPQPAKPPANAPPAAGANNAAVPVPVIVQAQVAAMLLQAPKPNEQTAVDDEEALADRELATYLAKAQQQLENENYTNGLLLLDHVLGAEQGGLIRPALELPLYQSLRAEAERTLADLPAVAREAYELRYGAVARKELDRALASGDLEALQAAIRRFRFTQAGAEASLIWARHLLDRNQPLSAAITLERLQQNWAAPPFDSATTWHHALSWLRAGMFQEARLRLGSLSDGERRTLQLAGLPVEMPDLLQRFAFGQTWTEERPEDWLLVRGDARRSGRDALGGLPWLRSRWSLPTTQGEPVSQALQSLQTFYREQHFSALPAAQPLAVGNRVLVRTVSSLISIDATTGQPVWSVPFEDGVEVLMQRDRASFSATSPQLLTGLDERQWGDLTYGTMSSDGQLVFGVEDVGFAFGLMNQRLTVGPDGSRRLDPGWPRDHNRLTAYDVVSGKLIWEIGGPQGALKLPLAGTYFLGPPLPLADQLYVVGEINRRIYLMVLDRRTGRPLSQQLLSTLETDPYAQVNFYNGMLPRREARRMSGASPSYADGILVCPVAGDKFVAVDLGSGEARWTFQPEQVAQRPNPFFRGFRRNVNQVDHRERRWVDTCVSLAAGRALLTPQGHDAIYCLDLQSGRLFWEAPRSDSQYLATIQLGLGAQVNGGRNAPQRDAVLLVGRSSVRSLSLDTGEDHWPALPLPAGGAPSGRGFSSEGNYYLPLNTGEVAVVDIVQGRIRQRTRSLSGSRPGNLICCADRIVSQTVDQVEAFDQIDLALADTAARLQASPNAIEIAAERAELLMFSGAHRQALEMLLEHYRKQASDGLRQRICTTIVAGLAADFDAFRPLAEEHQPLFHTADEKLTRLQTLADQLARAGESRAAFEALLQMTQLESEETPDIVQGDLSVARDRWLAGRLADIYQRAQPAVQGELAARLQELGRAALAEPGLEALERQLKYFAWHPSADEVRWAVLDRMDRADVLGRENHLLRLAAAPARATAGRAVAQLALLHTSAERPEAAASLYQRLRDQFGDQICHDGKTGAQLVAELPTNLEVSRLIQREDHWPTGRIDVTKGNQRVTSYQRSLPLEPDEDVQSLLGDLRLEAEQNGANLRIVARDGQGGVRWRFELPSPAGRSVAVNAGSLRIRLAGHLAVVHRGDEFFGISLAHSSSGGEGEGPRLLWRTSLTAKLPGAPGVQGFSQWVQQRPGRFPRLQMVDPFNGELAQLALVTPEVVCFHKMQTLHAVDAFTGRPLWKRFDFRPESEVIGDGEIILVMPPQGQEAQVLRAIDGQELGRCQVPSTDHRIASLGRRVVSWRQDQQGSHLTLDDPWQRQQIWKKSFTASAKFWLIGLDEIAVIDPTGRFAVVSLEDGLSRVDVQLDAEPDLTEMFVIRGPNQYLLFANSPQPVQGNVNPVPGGYHCPLVGGSVYGFDRETGKKLWKTSIPQLSLDTSQPIESPILALASRVYVQDGQNRITRQYSPLVCIDKRTGRKVHEEELSGSIGLLNVSTNPGNKSVEIRSNTSSIKLTLTSEPWDDKPQDK